MARRSMPSNLHDPYIFSFHTSLLSWKMLVSTTKVVVQIQRHDVATY
jgi:hypothetical protein